MIQSLVNINRAMRKLGMADESQYFIEIDRFTKETFIVESIAVTDWTLADSDYRLSVKLLSMNPIAPQDLLSKSAVISFLWHGALAPISGVVSEVTEAAGNGEYLGYTLKVESPLSLLKHQQHNRVFLGESAVEIAKQVLSEFLDGRYNLQVLASETDAYPMTVQYQESDWDFLHRILLRDGIMLHQHQSTEGMQVIIFDDAATLPLVADPVPLPYRSSRGGASDEEYVSVVRQYWRRQPQTVQVADYQFPSSQSIYAQSQTEATSDLSDVRWGDNTQTSEAAQKLAMNIAAAHKAESNRVFLSTNCPGLQPGMSIELTGHSQHNGRYLVVQIDVDANQSAGIHSGVSSAAKGYLNTVIAIAIDVMFLPLYQPQKPIASAVTATIAGEVDEAGLYRIKLPFDERPAGDDSSLPTRLMQPFGGHDHGMHFPLTEGTEVVLTFENGDIDRPTIMGAVYNDQSPNVVTGANAYQNLIRTRGQHELLMDDTPNEERIQLNTAEQKNRLQLDATQEQHRVELHTEEGDLELFAGKNMSVQSGTDMGVEVGGNQEITVKGDYTLMTEEGDITHQSGANVSLTAQQDLSWVAEDGQLSVQVGGQWVVEAAEGMSTQTVLGDHTVIVEQGSYQLEASDNLTFSAGAAITITNGSGSIQIDSGGNLTLDGPSVEITADKIAIKGATVGNN